MPEWLYTIDISMKLPTSVKVPIKGVNITGDLPVQGSAKCNLEGKVKWVCKTPKKIINESDCYSKVFNIERLEPTIKSSFKTSLYQLGSFLQPYVNTIPGVKAKITQPKFELTPRMNLCTENDGKCINALVECVLVFTPAKIKLTGKFHGVEASGEASIGSPGKSKFLANYRLCCCDSFKFEKPGGGYRYLPKYNKEKHGKIVITYSPDEALELDKAPAGLGFPRCATDHSVRNIPPPVRQVDKIKGLSWRIRTIEIDCTQVVATTSGKTARKPGKKSTKVRKPK